MPDARAERLREQALWCARLESPLYAHLLGRSAADAERGGVVARILEPYAQDSPASAPALRFLGAVHRLVLEGRAEPLARHYPSVGGDARAAGAWDAFRAVLEAHEDEIRRLTGEPVQTNEVQRSAALLGGFLTAASLTGKPLRLLEIGASAGLNLRWDHFRYEEDGWEWGPVGSPVRLVDAWFAGRPPLPDGVHVAERRGCDPRPIDATTDEGRLRLRSYLWADQPARHALLDAAIEVARRVPAEVERAGAVSWLRENLASLPSGVATVVFHSIVLQYLDPDDRARVRELLEHAGERASRAAPLAWLFLEHVEKEAEVHLTIWPGGERRRIATCTPHGRDVRFTGAG